MYNTAQGDNMETTKGDNMETTKGDNMKTTKGTGIDCIDYINHISTKEAFKEFGRMTKTKLQAREDNSFRISVEVRGSAVNTVYLAICHRTYDIIKIIDQITEIIDNEKNESLVIEGSLPNEHIHIPFYILNTHIITIKKVAE